VGSVGSITHTGDLASGLAAAVVAPDSVALGLGVDAESDSDLSDAITERIVTRAEYRFLDRQREQRRGLIAKLFFCAKEAFYKCQYPVTERFLGFDDVELTFELEAGTFRVALVGEFDERVQGTARAEGRFLIAGGLVVAGAQLLRDKSS
jgi:4'-phosphopantetheinyl transferase EntD